MSVVIGEFEVVPDAQPPAGAQPAAAPPPAAPDAQQLQALLQLLHEQALRTWAH